jgi:DNA-binding LacI/PurR family transcriptional regulator
MMNSGQRYTIDEIATAAGVSKATVSRVMNGTAAVSEDKKKLVEATIKKMGYHPNQNARKLAGGMGGSIALVLEESTEEFFLNPFWKSVVQGFIDEASSEGLHPVLFFHSKDDSDEVLINALIRGNYDAVAIFGWHRDIKILERYVPKNMIIVFGGNQGKSKRFTYVGVDNEIGGELATQHLIEQGCKSILTITGDLTIQSARERLLGYEHALMKAKIKAEPRWILKGDFTQESAEAAVSKYLKKGAPFDGIFAANDLMAVGALKALQAAGLKVPENVKLIGFDGSEIARKSEPSISTISQPSYVLGNTVARNLAKALQRESIRSVKLDLNLEIGDTTKKK